MMVSGMYSSYRYPAQTQIAEATEVYLGGHEYVIDEATKNRLTNPTIGGNYGDYITQILTYIRYKNTQSLLKVVLVAS
jgi:hypothetical protein